MVQARRDICEPEIPPSGFHILEWFWALDAGRSSTGFGVNPIGYPDILAWGALTGADPEPWEVMAIKALDMAMLSEQAAMK